LPTAKFKESFDCVRDCLNCKHFWLTAERRLRTGSSVEMRCG
jgi:hypothetical protein